MSDEWAVAQKTAEQQVARAFSVPPAIVGVDLATFLRERIAEDDARWRDCHRCAFGNYWMPGNDPCRHQREIESKRLLLANHWAPIHRCDGGDFATGDGECEIQRAVAVAYAGHPDYREEWGR